MEDPTRGGEPGDLRPETPPPGQPQPPPAYQARPNAPGAVASLVLGILGLTICQLCAPFAWWQGQQARAAVDRSGGTLNGRGLATAGWIMGIIGTVILGIAIVGILAVVVVGGASGD